MADKKTPAAAPEDPLAAFGLTMPALPTITAGNARQPLGPPQGFYGEQTAFQGAAADPEFQAKGPYINGDEWTPGYSMDPVDRDRLKSRMNAAGLYGTSGYQSGSWTPDDAKAYQTVLESANAMGRRDADVVIDNLAQQARAGARVQGPKAPLVSRITNPDDIRAVLRQSAYDLTGSRLSDADEQRLIAAYQGQQTAADQAANAGAGGAPGSATTVTNEAGMANFANAQIEQMRPADVATHRHLAAFEKILTSMGTLAPETPTYAGGGMGKGGGEVL